MPAKTEKGPAASVGAVDRTIALLELMALAEEPLKLSDAAHRLGIPKSAAHRILTTLIDNDWARQNNESGCYSLTIRMALFGQRQLEHLKANDLRQPILDDLAARGHETARVTLHVGLGTFLPVKVDDLDVRTGIAADDVLATRLSVGRSTLEDVFLDLTGRDLR